MESAFGESFSGVEVHADGNAAEVSSDLKARAFTVGNQIAFAAGEYQPGTMVGDALIAHELAHVVQQRSGVTSVDSKQVGATDYDALEEDADQAAVGAVLSKAAKAKGKIAVGGKNVMPALKSGLRLQRCGSGDKTPIGPSSPDVTGKYIATWGDVLTSCNIIGGLEIVAPSKVPGETGSGYDTFQDALAYAHVGIASHGAQGGVIIKKETRFFAFTITLDSWVDDFTRSNLEELSTLDSSGSEVAGIQTLITQDGYAAPFTKSPSPSKSIPVHIVDRESAGGYWHSTKAPEASGYQTMLKDIAEGRKTDMTPEGYVALFKGLLRARSQERLEQNSKMLVEEAKKYEAPEGDNEDWQRLREVIEKDRELARFQELYSDEAMAISEMIGRAGTALLTSSTLQRKYDEMGVYNELAAEAKQARNTLRAQYPALAVLDKTSDIDPETSNREVHDRMTEGFKDVQDMITDVSNRIHEEDIPLSKLGPLVKETQQEMGVTEEKRKEGDAMSKAVLGWLDSQDTKEAWITWTGTILSLGLGIAAIIASGGTALILGLAGSIIGAGNAVYSFEQADDLYAAAKAGTGGKPLVDDPEAARFNYIMGWVNLVLAGLDLGLAAKAGTTMLKGAAASEKIAGAAGADILKSLKPEQIVQFDKAMQLRRAGQLAESEAILSKLKASLGDDAFAKASSLFGRASAVEELFGASSKISEQARKALQSVDESMLRKLAALGEETAEVVGQFITRAGGKAAQFVSDMGDDAVKLILKNAGKAGGEADTVLKLFSGVGVIRTRQILALPGMTIAKLDDLLKLTKDAAMLDRILTHIPDPAEVERLIKSAGLGPGPDALRLDRTLQGMGPGTKNIPDVELALEAKKKIDKKILYGEQKTPHAPGTTPAGASRELRGAHSPEILSDPDFDILSKTTNADGTVEVKFRKLLASGPPPVYSKTKSSTLGPPSWADDAILEAGDKVAQSAPTRVAPDGRTLHIQKVNGIEWCVIKDSSGNVTSSFPTGGNPVPF